jgi:DNA-binding transcriptional ArsR family regulator
MKPSLPAIAAMAHGCAKSTSELSAWSFAVRAVRATLLVDPTLTPAIRWADQLDWIGQMPAAQFAAMMLRPLLRLRGRPGNLADPQVRDSVITVARARGPATVRAVRLTLDDPESARRELADLLARCWSVFFQAEWELAAPVLHREIEVRARRCARDGWLASLHDLSPAVQVRPDGRIVIDKVQSKRLAVAGRGLVLVPTILGSPHVYVADEPARPVVVHYPIPVPPRTADQRLTLRRLTVLAHPARLEVCRAIAVEPRSALEIARLWRFAESTVTKHLSVLRAAGLVRSERAQHFVRYSLDTSVIEALGADLTEVLRR